MRGATFTGNRTIGMVDIPDPTPGPLEVVLEMKASGICGSDLRLYRGPGGGAAMGLPGITSTDPVIGGHEPCGVVAAVGSAVDQRFVKVGDRVMVHHYWGCGYCDHCRTGWSQMCDGVFPKVYGISHHGGHAPYMLVEAATLVPLPEELSFAAGAAMSCGTGTAYQGLKRIGVAGDHTVAVFGQGPVGLAGTQFAKALGARVVAVDIDDSRLALARKLGADEVINSTDGGAADRIRELTGGKGADRVLEASGAESARLDAIQCTRKWGEVAMVGAGGDVKFPIANILQSQITIHGSWTFSNAIQAELARFAAAREIAVDAIFTNTWSLDQVEDAYKLVDTQSSGKSVIEF